MKEHEDILPNHDRMLPQKSEGQDIAGAMHLLTDTLIKTNASFEELTSPVIERLVASEKQAWSGFLGSDIEIPSPPRQLLETMIRAKQAGFYIFEPHFLPDIELESKVKYPGWKIKPRYGDCYWTDFREGSLNRSFVQLDNLWALIDVSPKPNFDGGGQLYNKRSINNFKGDPLSPILAQLREEGKIKVPAHTPDHKKRELMYIPPASRFGISWEEITEHVNPTVAGLLNVNKSQVRLPKGIEFNVLGNLYFPEWGQGSTEEWLQDNTKNPNYPDFIDYTCYMGGFSGTGGLGSLRRTHRPYDRGASLGFRQVVTFPTQ